jgi:site-specific DNA-cytosine methylase
MRELSLFSGCGGGILGAMLLGWRTVAAVERDPYCVRLLCERGGYVADAKQGDSGRRSDEQERDAEEREKWDRLMESERDELRRNKGCGASACMAAAFITLARQAGL